MSENSVSGSNLRPPKYNDCWEARKPRTERMSENGVSSSNKVTLNWILNLALNRGVSEKDESKVKIISGKSEEEDFSAQLRQCKSLAGTRVVELKINY